MARKKAILHKKAQANAQEPTPLPTAKSAEQTLLGSARTHVESLGAAWIAVSGIPPKDLIPQVIPTVLTEGGTRPSWKWRDGELEYVLLAWPKVSGLRAAVLLRGQEGQTLQPVSCVPLCEGLPNDLTIESVHPWEEGCGANVGCDVLGADAPLWMYDPFYVRDKNDLSPGVTQPVLLAALAFGVRKALLDEISITSGASFEQFAKAWLEHNPDKTRLDVPPLKINVAGKHIIQPGRAFGEYQMRAVIQDIDTCTLSNMPIKILYTSFPLENRAPLSIPVYVATLNLGGYEPKVGDDIDAYVWFQGRIVDWDGAEDRVEAEEGTADEADPKPSHDKA